MMTRDSESFEDVVREIAYRIYEDNGRTKGRDLDNWIEAEHIALARCREKTDVENEACSSMPFEG